MVAQWFLERDAECVGGIRHFTGLYYHAEMCIDGAVAGTVCLCVFFLLEGSLVSLTAVAVSHGY